MTKRQIQELPVQLRDAEAHEVLEGQGEAASPVLLHGGSVPSLRLAADPHTHAGDEVSCLNQARKEMSKNN